LHYGIGGIGGKLRDSLRKLHSSSGHVTKDQLNALLSDISRALIESDVNVKMVMGMRERIKTRVLQQIEAEEAAQQPDSDQQKRASTLSKTVQKAVVDELTSLLSPESKPYTLKKGKPNVILFVGLQGSGKTTSIAKFANYHQRRGWKTAMVCADTFRAGAFDQLKQNATKLRVPFYGSYTQADPVQIAQEGVTQFQKEKYEVIIVDTSGRHKQETALFEEMQEISAAVNPHNTILVVDATQGQAVYDQALAFHSAVSVGSVIVTKLDGGAKGGGALSAVAATRSPIVFTGTGEHFEDLESFHAESFVSKLLGYGDLRGLAEAFKSVDGGDDKDKLLKQLEAGKFCLRDMYNQFQKVLSMGSMQKLMGMMPGMPDYLIPKGGDQEATGRLKKFMYMMDSMTDAELDGKVDLSKRDDPQVQSRVRRIAAGSGTHIQEVLMLLQVHKQFEGMVGKNKALFGKSAQAKQQQMAAQLRKNPNLIQQRLNQMDPRVLQQMGGRDAVAAMMQQMAKGGGGAGGGMPDMSAMMGAMGGMPGMDSLMGAGGGMPGGMDMEAMMKMAQSMGMGGGMPGMMGPGGAGNRR
jgi:signal recognition particle subunit SRP54